MGSPGFKMLVGAAAGFLIWLVMEPMAPKDLFSSTWTNYEQQLVLLLGIAIGVALGGLSGWMQGGKVHTLRGLFLGAAFGAFGVSMGAGIGNAIAHATGLEKFINPAGGTSLLAIPARIVALTPLGTFLGAGIGASSLSWRRAVQGAIGGTIGAGIGAALFDPLGMIFGSLVMGMKGVPQNGVAEVGIFGRATFCVILGAGIGLFIGLVEQVSKVAWLRLVLGRNEGKEWIVDAPQTFIGRSETAQVPLFGDNAIAPMHAVILHQGPSYLLADNGSQTGTFLNGQAVMQIPVPLFHGAVIQVGSYRLEFLMKVGSAPQRAAEVLRAQQHYAMQGQVPVAAPFSGPMGAQPAMPGQATGYGQPVYSPGQQTVAIQPAAVPAVSTSLMATAGPMTGQRFQVDHALEAGREGSGIAMSFDQVASRRHASFAPSAAGIVVTDLNSTNGTFVNEQRIQNATLNKGDLVRIGVTVFRAE